MTTADEIWTLGPGFNDTDREALVLMERVGIKVEIPDPTPGEDFLSHRDRHGDPDRDALVLWFLTEYDQDALQELTGHAPDEFGCDWAQIYPTGLRAEFVTGTHATAIPRRDLPVVIDLLRRELAGEFAVSARAYRRLKFATARQVIALLTVAAALLGIHVKPQNAGMFTVSIVLGFFVLVFIEISKSGNPAARRSALDWVRARAES